MADLDIVVPVYNEGRNVIPMLDALHRHVRVSFRVLICYDMEEDNTLDALREYPAGKVDVVLIKNPQPGEGPHGAVRAGLAASTSPAVLVYMADDDYNADVIDRMYERFATGCHVVAASRFIDGGCMTGCHWLKETITRVGSFFLNHLAGLPVHDGTNAFRLFSRRLLTTVEIESRQGFTFSVELLAKAVRLGWAVGEVPARWFERVDKPSRFRVARWLPAYLYWLLYACSTRWLAARRVTQRLPRADLASGAARPSDN